MQPLKYAHDEPLSHIIEYLEKSNEDRLAEQVIDVFAKDSSSIEQFNLIAKLYFDVRANEKAEHYILKMLNMTDVPQEKYNIRANAAKFYNNINEPDRSLSYSALNKLITPDDPDVALEQVFSYYLLNKKNIALGILKKLNQRRDQLEERHRDIIDFNMGTYLMEQGDFQAGLKAFMLVGQKLDLWFSYRELPFKFWSGGAYPGKTLILFCEGGGIGDEMISVRFMDNLKDIGFRPIFLTGRSDMYDLFNKNGYETIMSLNDIPKDVEDTMWTYFMQVPIYLKLTAEQVKRTDPYLQPSEEARKKWAWLKDTPGLNVGVRWQGNSKNERDLHRQVPLDGIMDTLYHTLPPDTNYYSLQIGDGADQINEHPAIVDYTKNIVNYDDTMAFLENLDLVVTSCTSVLHASAIVGTQTIGLIPISAYFTWVSPSPNNTSVWYGDNLKLFKQVTPKKWDEPFAEMNKYLKDNFKV